VRISRYCAIFSLIPALALTAAAQAPGPAPRFDRWTILGPGGGGTTASPTISPGDPNLVVERCDMTGAYISHDGGLSWRMFNLRSGLATFAFDPSDPRRIFAGGAALWRSDDAGQTWRMVLPNPQKKTVEHQNGDHGDYSLTTNDGSYVTGLSISQIAFDPKDAKIVHVAFHDPSTSGSTLLVSKDGGDSFHYEHSFDSEKILLLAYTGDRRIAIGNRGVYLGKAETAKPIAGSADPLRYASAAETQGTATIYVSNASGQVFVTSDSAATWREITPDLPHRGEEFQTIATGGNGQTAYLGFRGLMLSDDPDHPSNGILKTTDQGKTWSIVFREATGPAANLDPSWIEQRAIGTSWSGGVSILFDAPYALAVAPGNPEICYATDLFRTYRTLDGGKSWAQVNSVRTPDGNWTTRGLDVTTDYGVQFDPFDVNHIFIDYTDIGLFQSQNGGRSWQSSTDGIPQVWRNTTYWLAFDPDVKGLVWGAFSGIHDLPLAKMWRGKDALSRFRGGVAVSTDGGLHWTPSNDGMEETAFTHILLDPASPAGRRTLYACGFGVGVYKSTDNGKTWQLKNQGISEANPFAWRLTRADDGTLYLIVARSNGGNYGATQGSGAIYKSVDGAEHWTELTLPKDVNGPWGLALDPRDNRRMYLAAWGQEHSDVDVGGGVYLTTDGGQSWKPIFQGSQHVYDVTVDPKSPGNLYISGFDAGAWRSTDAGAHWTRIRGYNFKWGHRVIVDPRDSSKIFITTYGGSVWYGPAAGDPAATEDILTLVPVAQ
jgi:photosystem II stability/assembly factor-like uncharacterized protein